MQKKQKVSTSSRTSLYLPEEYREAMDAIHASERVQKSHQIQIGLLMYFTEKHKKLLLSKGINLWK